MSVLVIVLVAAGLVTLWVGGRNAISDFFGWVSAWLFIYLLVAAGIGLVVFTLFRPAQSLYVWVPLGVLLLARAGVRAFLRNRAKDLIKKVPAPVGNYQDNLHSLGDYARRVKALDMVGERYLAGAEYCIIIGWEPELVTQREKQEFERLNSWWQYSSGKYLPR